MTTPSTIPTPAEPAYFDYRGPAAAAGVSPQDLQSIIRIFEADYPSDLMLRELHILRACRAILEGRSTIRQLLAPQAA